MEYGKLVIIMESTGLTALAEEFDSLKAQNSELKESLEDVRRSLAFEDRGWQIIGSLLSGENVEGLTLSEAQEISNKIRPYLVGGSLVKRGSDLHTGYVWAKGMNIEGVEKTGKRGAPSVIQNFYANSVNQESLFSPEAHGELQRARYSDGTVFLLCDATEKTVRRIPLSQISGVRVNPDFPEEVWAYQRTWNPNLTSLTTASVLPRVRWYYTARFTGNKQASFTSNGVTVAVDKQIIIDQRFNRQVGWPLGIPDAVAALPWYHAYSEIMRYGRVVNESLSKILYKIISATPKGAQNAAVKIAGMSGHGNSASMTDGADVQAVSTAGKGYDFANARPVAAMMAASLNVPNVELLSDSAAAGSSYGAAATLGPSTINAMQMIQDEWMSMLASVFKFFGFPVPKMSFDPINEPDFYRTMQGITLGRAGLTNEEYRAAVLDHLNIVGDPNVVTPGMLAAVAQTTSQAASPDQGVANGAGTSADSSDLRTDTISESLKALASFNMDELRELVIRMEHVKNS